MPTSLIFEPEAAPTSLRFPRIWEVIRVRVPLDCLEGADGWKFELFGLAWLKGGPSLETLPEIDEPLKKTLINLATLSNPYGHGTSRSSRFELTCSPGDL